MKQHDNNLIEENNQLTLQLSNHNENIRKFLSDDQIMKLSQPRVQWITKTIKMEHKYGQLLAKIDMNFLDNLLIIHFFFIGHFVVTQMHCKCHVIYSMILFIISSKKSSKG